MTVEVWHLTRKLIKHFKTLKTRHTVPVRVTWLLASPELERRPLVGVSTSMMALSSCCSRYGPSLVFVTGGFEGLHLCSLPGGLMRTLRSLPAEENTWSYDAEKAPPTPTSNQKNVTKKSQWWGGGLCRTRS